MIKSFAHKGLELYFHKGSKKGIQAKHAQKIGLILDRLGAARIESDMNYPGSDFHALKGNYKNLCAVKVSGNWRILFRFSQGNAYDVDYLDYH